MIGTRLLAAALAVAAASGGAIPSASAQSRADDRVGAGFTDNRPDGPSRRDWLRTRRRTEDGGFVIGNPEARTRLVEYLAPSCTERAQFTLQAADRLFQQMVRNGRVSVEYRPYYRNGVDIAAGMLLNCLPAYRYFDMMHGLLGAQPNGSAGSRG